MSLRILLWYWGRRGGGAQFTLGLARALARRDDVALSLALSAQGELAPAFHDLGVPVSLTDTYRDLAGFLAATPRIPFAARALRRQAAGCDAVVSAMTHLWTPLVAPGLARAGAAFVPVVHDASPHAGDFGWAWNWRLGRELAAARAAVALSDAVARDLSARAPGLPQIRMTLPALLSERLPRVPGEGRLLFFGRLRAYKGLDLLRDAFDQVRLRHPTATLRVVGEGDVGSLAPGLDRLPGVTVEPRWVPETEVPALLAQADLVVLPYREATQSGIVPQALAMGVPVVATPVGGLTEQLAAGGGLIARDASAPALADALAAALEPRRLEALRGAVAQAAELVNDWDTPAASLVAGLRGVVGR
ncbi:glycosyltransferase family 4 protein [Falsiroseomonas oryziterrae]|uniref:glycosyltransferase family 4 protein n=1 Tax=Falsiroseomonas oryziterrae TaxID=2911368 RepID=UPI001F39A3AE|nr:glycosyltransferase family 4 protein [Roseomonas sp. NPKOSM-4]